LSRRDRAWRKGEQARSGKPKPAPERGRFFATAAKGTEALLAKELREIGLPRVSAERGGVRFGAEIEDAYRACLWTRIALRIVEPLASFECQSADQLYAGARRIDWSPLFGGKQTLAIRAVGRADGLTHTHFIALRTKDAIVDQLRERAGHRPDVDRDDADVLVFVHLANDRATVHLDYSGSSLHARGLRQSGAVAPLRETLAAALVRFSGWRGNSPVVDPMCGSGTLLLEAAAWAGRRAPGLSRARFGFERWHTFGAAEADILARLKAEARDAARPIPELFGSDTNPEALRETRSQAERAGFALRLRQLPLARLSPADAPGALLMNPPYGQRLERSRELERDVETALERYAGWQRGMIVPLDFPISRGATRWLQVYNGPIECELRRFDAGRGGPAQPSAEESDEQPEDENAAGD
jgi:23S rRNA G2445 N2-methylase RlmL